MSKRIDPKGWYPCDEAAVLLGGRVTPDTVKAYCKARKYKGLTVSARQKGPKQRWYIEGRTLSAILKLWGEDDS